MNETDTFLNIVIPVLATLGTLIFGHYTKGKYKEKLLNSLSFLIPAFCALGIYLDQPSSLSYPLIIPDNMAIILISFAMLNFVSSKLKSNSTYPYLILSFIVLGISYPWMIQINVKWPYLICSIILLTEGYYLSNKLQEIKHLNSYLFYVCSAITCISVSHSTASISHVLMLVAITLPYALYISYQTFIQKENHNDSVFTLLIILISFNACLRFVPDPDLPFTISLLPITGLTLFISSIFIFLLIKKNSLPLWFLLTICLVTSSLALYSYFYEAEGSESQSYDYGSYE